MMVFSGYIYNTWFDFELGKNLISKGIRRNIRRYIEGGIVNTCLARFRINGNWL